MQKSCTPMCQTLKVWHFRVLNSFLSIFKDYFTLGGKVKMVLILMLIFKGRKIHFIMLWKELWYNLVIMIHCGGMDMGVMMD